MIGGQIKNHLQELAPSKEATTLPNSEYLEVELTFEETEEALRKGREAKFFKEQNDKYWADIRAKASYNVPGARELFDALRQTKSHTGKPFQVTDWNKEIIFALCLYFSGSRGFEERYKGMSLKKGILLMGPQGTGKSHLLSFFQVNPHCSYKNITTKTIAEQYAHKWERDGMDTLQYYCVSSKASFGHAYGQTDLGYCFGDLGTEPNRKQFGNESNVMEHIIFQRYENRLPFNQTHFTTNMDTKEIVDAYGVRIGDRLKEMCNIFLLEGESWRSPE